MYSRNKHSEESKNDRESSSNSKISIPFSDTLHLLSKDSCQALDSGIHSCNHKLAISLTWASEVLAELGSSNEAFFRAATLFYQFLDKVSSPLKVNEIQAYICGAILLAIDCMDEEYSRGASFEQLSIYTDHSYSADQIKAYFEKMLDLLDYEVLQITTLYESFYRSKLYNELELPQKFKLTTLLKLIMCDSRHTYWPNEMLLESASLLLFKGKQTRDKRLTPISQDLIDNPIWIKGQIQCNQWMQNYVDELERKIKQPDSYAADDKIIPLVNLGLQVEKIHFISCKIRVEKKSQSLRDLVLQRLLQRQVAAEKVALSQLHRPIPTPHYQSTLMLANLLNSKAFISYIADDVAALTNKQEQDFLLKYNKVRKWRSKELRADAVLMEYYLKHNKSLSLEIEEEELAYQVPREPEFQFRRRIQRDLAKVRQQIVSNREEMEQMLKETPGLEEKFATLHEHCCSVKARIRAEHAEALLQFKLTKAKDYLQHKSQSSAVDDEKKVRPAEKG